MAYAVFVAPIVGTIHRNDVIVVQNYSGQNAGGPTTCFKSKQPIYLADLTREGENQAVSIELIPLSGTVWRGIRLTNFTLMGKCTLGPEEVQMYRGEVERNCGCGGKKRTNGEVEVKGNGNENGNGNGNGNAKGTGKLWYSPGYNGIRKP